MRRLHPLLLISSLLILAASCVMVSLHEKSPVNERIRVISSMSEVSMLAPHADLIIFDIDHTILEAKTNYCHSNWFYDLYEEAILNGVSEKTALNTLLPPWEQSQKDCAVKPVEAMTPSLIKELQASGKNVMALTSRGKNVEKETITQLQSLNIDFAHSAPIKEDFSMDLGAIVAQKNGVVFTTDYVPKGEVLKAYLKRAEFHPRRVLFVDDSKRNLVSVVEVMHREGIKVDALHYPLVKRTLPYWDKELAKKEWEKRHGKIIYR